MDKHIKDFFSVSKGKESDGTSFYRVISLQDENSEDWEDLSAKCDKLPRGWFELTNLKNEDRIEFTRDFWISKLPFHVGLSDFLTDFFNRLDDIVVFLTQKNKGDKWAAHMVYSLDQDRGFFRGATPAEEADIVTLQGQFQDCILPNDFLAFLTIHNGFWKATDTTGILDTHNMFDCYKNVQEYLSKQDRIVKHKGKSIDPSNLIPFYESFGMPYFQCFWKEWYPEEEMGNVYLSAETQTISDGNLEEDCTENLAFPSFSEWLMFYLEQVE